MSEEARCVSRGCEYSSTGNSEIHRNTLFGSYDKDLIHSLIDDAPYCHVSAQVGDYPYIQATIHWRNGEKLHIHGAKKNKMIRAIAKGVRAALAFTHFDGYVLTRSAFAHGVLYRSVTMFGTAREISDLSEKTQLLNLFIEKICPGRWDTVRPPTREELKMTGLLEFTISEVSAKVVQDKQILAALPGGKWEVPKDSAFHPWTGIHPYALTKGAPVPTQHLIERWSGSSESPQSSTVAGNLDSGDEDLVD